MNGEKKIDDGKVGVVGEEKKDSRQSESLLALSQMVKGLDVHIRSQASFAMLTRARYDALVKTGFTETQALEIIKARGITP